MPSHSNCGGVALLTKGFELLAHLLLVEAPEFLQLHVLAGRGEAADEGGGAADGVSLGLGLGLLLLGDGLDLV